MSYQPQAQYAPEEMDKKQKKHMKAKARTAGA